MKKEIIQTIVEIINANSFCSLGRDCLTIDKLRTLMMKDGLLEKTDDPYIGCVKVSERKPIESGRL